MATPSSPPRWFAALAALTLASCGGADRSFSNPPCPEAPAGADGYDITLDITPADRHVAEVLTFSFLVKFEGTTVEGLNATGSYRHLASGAAGTIALTAQGAGQYVGTKPLFSEGAYGIGIEFRADGRTVSRSFPLAITSH